MISSRLKGYWIYRNYGVAVFDWKNCIQICFEKRGIFSKIPFLHKAFHGVFWKRDYFIFIMKHQPCSVTKLITGKTCFFPYQSNSCYEWDCECRCIVINDKTCSVPLNILSSVCSTLMTYPMVFYVVIEYCWLLCLFCLTDGLFICNIIKLVKIS